MFEPRWPISEYWDAWRWVKKLTKQLYISDILVWHTNEKIKRLEGEKQAYFSKTGNPTAGVTPEQSYALGEDQPALMEYPFRLFHLIRTYHTQLCLIRHYFCRRYTFLFTPLNGFLINLNFWLRSTNPLCLLARVLKNWKVLQKINRINWDKIVSYIRHLTPRSYVINIIIPLSLCTILEHVT